MMRVPTSTGIVENGMPERIAFGGFSRCVVISSRRFSALP